jgi:hypothetical protein
MTGVVLSEHRPNHVPADPSTPNSSNHATDNRTSRAKYGTDLSTCYGAAYRVQPQWIGVTYWIASSICISVDAAL